MLFQLRPVSHRPLFFHWCGQV